jgi:hypothetical protein
MREYEEIDNIKLIRNNLRHIRCELDSEESSPMRLAKECHQLLLRMMVEALRGTANFAITGMRRRERWYRQDDGPWKMIQKESIEGCRTAWRYSEPVLESPPPCREEGSYERTQEDYLIGFYDLLAMIQAPCFMLRYIRSAVVSVPDSEMQLLEWLHENIRNDFEHFIPRTLLASSNDCLRAAETCLRLATDLLTRSNNITLSATDDLATQLNETSIAVAGLHARPHNGA